MITLDSGRIARVAELADAIALEAIRRNPVGVQVSPRAQIYGYLFHKIRQR